MNIVIVHSRDLSEAFLSCSVPDEQPNQVSRFKLLRVRVALAELHTLFSEVPTESRLSPMFVEVIFDEALN